MLLTPDHMFGSKEIDMMINYLELDFTEKI